MKADHRTQLYYELAPWWAERNMPVKSIVKDIPSVLMLKIPEEDYWVLASWAETETIADPESVVGWILRSHCGLLGLRHISSN